MVVAKNHAAVLKKLKAQVKLLQKKEEQSRNQLHAAFKKIHKLGTVFKSKLAKRIRVMQGKVMAAQASSYAKAAADFERQILDGIKRKTRSVVEAIAKFEKQQGMKSSKRRVVKAKKSVKSKERKSK